MIYVYLVILILFNACWLLTVPFMLPGNWLMLITTYLFAWWQWDMGIFGWPLLIAITILALIGEIIEFFAGAGGAKKAGSGWLGALTAVGGAIFGAVVGTGIMPVLGTILGACFGAGLQPGSSNASPARNKTNLSAPAWEQAPVCSSVPSANSVSDA